MRFAFKTRGNRRAVFKKHRQSPPLAEGVLAIRVNIDKRCEPIAGESVARTRGPMSLSAERKFDDRLTEICEDIRATLRVSILPTPFRLWSSNPRLLELLWSRLRPNLETRFVESAADAIRKHAARMVWGQPICHRIEAEEISLFTVQKCRLVINIHHYINPKLLLLVTALVETLRRHDFEPVRDASLTSNIPKGVPAEMATIHFLEESSVSQRKRNVLKEIQSVLALPEISTEY